MFPAVEVGFAGYPLNIVSEEKQQSHDQNDAMMALNDLMAQHGELQNATASAPATNFTMADFIDFDMGADGALDMFGKDANMVELGMTNSTFVHNLPVDALNLHQPCATDFDISNLLNLDHLDATTSDR